MRPFWFAALLAALPAPTPAHAEKPVACPPFLEVAQTTQPPRGFTAYADGNPVASADARPHRLPLRTIMFSEGPPTEQAWLAPSASNATKSTWSFAAAQDTAIWLSCAYTGTILLLSAPLSKDIKQCTIRDDQRDPVSSGPECR